MGPRLRVEPREGRKARVAREIALRLQWGQPGSVEHCGRKALDMGQWHTCRLQWGRALSRAAEGKRSPKTERFAGVYRGHRLQSSRGRAMAVAADLDFLRNTLQWGRAPVEPRKVEW